MNSRNIYYVFAVLIISLQLRMTALAQSQKKSQSLVEKAVRLRTLAHNQSPDTCQFQRDFFTYFPESFNELDSLYGYKENKRGKLTFRGQLQMDAEKHILDIFNNLYCIPEKTYFQKLVDISIGGHWESDGISYFQKGLQERVLLNPGLAYDLLKKKTDKEVESFWFFYFDEPHPEPTIPEALLKMKPKDQRVYALMLRAKKRVRTD